MNFKIFSKFNLKQKILASILIFIVFIFVIVYFTILPSVKDILIIKNDIYAQKVDLEKKYKKGQNLRSLTEKLTKAEERMYVLDQALVKSTDNLKFITTLEGIAEKNNVILKINIPKTEEANSVFYKIPIQIYSQGLIKDQIKYLIDLETLNFYLNVNSLEITSSATQVAGGASVSMFLTADTYWSK
jgi:Tfp pilus assembly protein PilO